MGSIVIHILPLGGGPGGLPREATQLLFSEWTAAVRTPRPFFSFFKESEGRLGQRALVLPCCFL